VQKIFAYQLECSMNEKTIFIRTSSGEDEVRSRTAHLSKDIKRALLMVDGTATVAEITKRSSPSLRAMLEDMFVELENGGFIQDKSKPVSEVERVVVQLGSKKALAGEDLDFTAAFRVPTPEVLAEEAAKLQRIAADKASAEVAGFARAVEDERARLKEEVAKLKAQQQTDVERRKLEAEARTHAAEAEQAKREAEEMRVKAELAAAKVQADADAKAHLEAERRASEAARIKAEEHAANVKADAEAKARVAEREKAKLEAEVAKLRAQAEMEAEARVAAAKQAKQEAEAARVKAEQEAARAKAEAEAHVEARAREEAERRAKEQAEAVRIKAEQEAAQARVEAEALARAAEQEKARLEAEVAKLKAMVDAEAEASAAAAERAKLEAEAARVKAEQEAARAKTEAEAHVETRAREDAERRANEAARIKSEVYAAKVKADAEAKARAAEQEKTKLKDEVARLKARAKMEAEARVAAVKQAKLEAEAARVKAEQQAASVKADAEARAREYAERRAGEEAKAMRIKVEQRAAQAGAEAEARVAAAEQAKRDAEAARVKAEREAVRAKAEAEAHVETKLREEAERRAREEAETSRIKAEQARAEQAARVAVQEKASLEAEVASLKAQAEAQTRARAEEAEQARQYGQAQAQAAEADRIKAEQAAAQARFEAEARTLVETEAATLNARQASGAVRQNIGQAATRVRDAAVTRDVQVYVGSDAESDVRTNDQMLAAVVRLNAKHAQVEDNVFAALDNFAQDQEASEYFEAMQDGEIFAASLANADAVERAASDSVTERGTTIATVAFFDIVDYSKQPNVKQVELKKQFGDLVAHALGLLGAGERVVLDTGDGVAIGFLQHPTDALEAAMQFRTNLMANGHSDYPDLRARIGIHLGPVSLVKDINGQINMLGDGINSAQRVMSFAGRDQVYVSRAYFDFLSSLSEEYNELFRYRGSQRDKHGREFQVYELQDAGAGEGRVEPKLDARDEPENALAPFNLEDFDAALLSSAQQELNRDSLVDTPSEFPRQANIADQLLSDVAGLGKTEVALSVAQPVVAESPSQEDASQADASQKTVETVRADKPEAAIVEQKFTEQDARRLADAQAMTWSDAERRALEIARKNSESVAHKAVHPPIEIEPTAKVVDKRSHRKPIPRGKVAVGVIVLLLFVLFVICPGGYCPRRTCC